MVHVMALIHTTGSNYFSTSDGKPVYLTGSHTWNDLQNEGSSPNPAPLDYTAYVKWMEDNNYNFMRLWNIAEQPTGAAFATPWYTDPVPYQRTGPGTAADGNPKFDLTKFNQGYFDNLRSKVIEAGQHGIYTDVMLFEGWSLNSKGSSSNPWTYHPYNANNNINGINGDPLNTGNGNTIQTTSESQSILDLQKAYVRKVIDTVGDLPNVLYEISNESESGSTQWQYNMIDYVKSYQVSKGQNNPVGMTENNAGDGVLFSSPADWISPNYGSQYYSDMPANNGSKVILSDTDHLWGQGGDASWVWESFTRGLNPIFMDDLGQTGISLGGRTSFFDPDSYSVRLGMTETANISDKMDLTNALPHGDLTDTGYVLADLGKQYAIFDPDGGSLSVNLSAGSGSTFSAQWINVYTGAVVDGGTVSGSSNVTLTAPFSGASALFLDKTTGAPPPPPPLPVPDPTPPIPPTGTTYYVSANGLDSNDGKSPDHPWKTLDKVSSTTFHPGDSILLNKGDTFTGSLQLQGSGTTANAITLSSYGTGADPIISAGSNEEAIKLQNQDHWDISHIETTGGTRFGIYVTGDTPNKEFDGISIHDVKVHDVFGSSTPSPLSGLVVVLPQGQGTTFGDVKIDNVTAYNTNQWLGIHVGYNLTTNENATDIPLSHDIQITNSNVSNVGGNIITVFEGDNVLLQNNIAHDGGTVSTLAPTPNAIWTWRSSNVLVDHNEAYNMHTATNDGGGFDIDWGSKNVTVQNNYAHDNDGYGVAIIGFGGLTTSNSVIKNNIFSNNDLKQGGSDGEIFLWGDSPIDGVQIENNTVTQSPGTTSFAVDLTGGTLNPSSTNIFTGNKINSTGNFVKEDEGIFSLDNNTYVETGSSTPNWTYHNSAYSNFSNYQTSTGQDQHSTFDDGSSPPPPPPEDDLTPTDLMIGQGPDSLVLNVSQDHFKGSAQYTVSVDGKQIDGTLTAHADHAQGTEDVVTVNGDWAPGTHQVEVTLVNDLWDGTEWWTQSNGQPDGHDRNVYVEEATYNGIKVANSSLAIQSGGNPQGFTFVDSAPPIDQPPVIIDTSKEGLWTFAKSHLNEIDELDMTSKNKGNDLSVTLHLSLDPDGSGPLGESKYTTSMKHLSSSDLAFVKDYLAQPNVSLLDTNHTGNSTTLIFGHSSNDTASLNITEHV
jgi:Right handed beta helix region/Family of unknown function (DUF6298)